MLTGGGGGSIGGSGVVEAGGGAAGGEGSVGAGGDGGESITFNGGIIQQIDKTINKLNMKIS